LGKDVQALKPGTGQALAVTSDQVFALDASSGAELWSQSIQQIAVTANRVYGIVDDYDKDVLHVIAFDLDGGKEVWRTSLHEDPTLYVAPRPLQSGAVLYVNRGSVLYMLDLNTGAPRGIQKSGYEIGGFDGGVIAAEVGKLSVVAVEGGKRLIALRRQ
jgi:outer membrane protein assembly factor BamB